MYRYGGLYDPPKPLTAVPFEATPTVPTQPSTTPASPSSTPGSGQPPATSTSAQQPISTKSTGASGRQSTESSDPQQTVGSEPGSSTTDSSGGSGGSRGSGSDTSHTTSSPNPGGIIVSIIAGGTGTADNGGGSGGLSGVGSGAGDPGSSDDGALGGATTETFTFAGSTVTVVASGGIVVIDPSGSQASQTQGDNPGSSSGSGSNSGGCGNSGSDSSGETQIITKNGNTLTIVQSGRSSGAGATVVNGQTLTPGAPAATISGVAVSAGNSGVVVGSGGAKALVTAPDSESSSPGQTTTVMYGHRLTVGELSGSAGDIIVDGSTLSNGGSAITISGVTVSATSGGLVVNGQTTSIADSTAGAGADSTALLTSDGQTFTVIQATGSAGSSIVVDGTTLSNGGSAAMIDGVTVSAGPSGSVVLDGHTTTLSVGSPGETTVTEGGQVFTVSAGPFGVEVINGVTLSCGDVTVVDSVTVSNDGNGLALEAGMSKTTVVVEVSPTDGRTTTESPDIHPAANTGALKMTSGSGLVQSWSTLCLMPLLAGVCWVIM